MGTVPEAGSNREHRTHYSLMLKFSLSMRKVRNTV